MSSVLCWMGVSVYYHIQAGTSDAMTPRCRRLCSD